MFSYFILIWASSKFWIRNQPTGSVHYNYSGGIDIIDFYRPLFVLHFDSKHHEHSYDKGNRHQADQHTQDKDQRRLPIWSKEKKKALIGLLLLGVLFLGRTHETANIDPTIPNLNFQPHSQIKTTLINTHSRGFLDPLQYSPTF